MTLLCSLHDRPHSFMPSEWLRLVLYFVDPLLLQGLTLCVAVLALFVYYRGAADPSRGTLSSFLTATYLPVLVIFVGFAVEVLLVRPLFAYSRPLIAMGNSLVSDWLTGVGFANHLIASPGGVSGFVFREVVLILLILHATFGGIPTAQLSDRVKSRGATIAFLLCGLFLMLLVGGRIMTGINTAFDVGIAVGAAVYFYWVAMVVINSLIFGVSQEWLADIMRHSCAFLPLFLVYSNGL